MLVFLFAQVGEGVLKHDSLPLLECWCMDVQQYLKWQCAVFVTVRHQAIKKLVSAALEVSFLQGQSVTSHTLSVDMEPSCPLVCKV